MSRTCARCKVTKTLDSFSNKKGTFDGLRPECRSCASEENRKFNRSKDGVVSSIYRGQKTSSKKRGMHAPLYAKKELREWLFSQKEFHELFSEWQANDFDSKLKPSVDRLDDYQGYKFSNIRLVTWDENRAKSHSDMKSGKNTKQAKPVLMYKKDGTFIREFFSIMNAARETNSDDYKIILCCKKKRHTHNGYIWRYKGDFQ